MSGLVLPFIDAAILVPVIILLTRLAGLRSFSKMSGFDFAVTVAMGSVLASVVVGADTTASNGIAALCALFLVQAIVARLRCLSDSASEMMDNAPLLVMDGKQIDDGALAKAKMTRADLMGKLREANVLRFDQVHAVVVEPTGDVSVLHSDNADLQVEDQILSDVRRTD